MAIRVPLAVLGVLAVAACESRRAQQDAPAPTVAADARERHAAIHCPGSPADCQACLAGSGGSCAAIAEGQPTDAERKPWYRRGCDRDDLDSCNSLASIYVLEPDSYELADAATARYHELLAKQHAARLERCAAHDEDSCADAAIDLKTGTGAVKDGAAGTRMLVASCTRGGIGSCTALAADKRGLSKAETTKYAKLACAGGHATTCGDLVGLFDEPAVAPETGPFVREQLRRQCDAKAAAACWVLGGLYWSGHGAARDQHRAATELAAACGLDATFCDDQKRVAAGGPYLPPLGPVPTLNVQPLLDALAKEQAGAAK